VLQHGLERFGGLVEIHGLNGRYLPSLARIAKKVSIAVQDLKTISVWRSGLDEALRGAFRRCR